MNDLDKFPERLSELMFYNNKNATQIAEDIGCESATISHYLAGLHIPTIDMAVRLADYFNVSTDFLLCLTEENKVNEFKKCPPFNMRFIEVCKICGVSRYKLNKLTGISESVMRYWVRGNTSPSVTSVIRIAEALERSVDYVLGREK